MTVFTEQWEQTFSGAPSPYLVVRDVSKSFGGTVVLNRVSLSVNKGEVITILGPSGSGKSTLLRVIAGLEVPDTGDIACQDRTYFSDRAEIRLAVEQRDIGMVFQDFGLWPHLTVFEHVSFPLWSRRRRGMREWSKTAIHDQALKTLCIFRMESLAHKRPHELSGGQQQRVAFARAVVAKPSLVLLDEAFSALDPQLQSAVREDLLDILRDARMTVLNVTHDQEEAMAVSDQILVLNQGVALQCAPPLELYQRPVNQKVAAFVGKGQAIPVRYDGLLTLRLPDGQRMTLTHPLEPGPTDRELQLWLRPEFLQVKTTRAVIPGAVIWTGRVLRRTYLLGRVEHLANIPQIGNVVFYHHEGLESGEVVELQLNLNRPHLMADGTM